MICDGHHEYDVIPFSKFKADKSDVLYTNKEFLSFIHPFNEDVPYLYDTFEWPQCESTYPIVTDGASTSGGAGSQTKESGKVGTRKMKKANAHSKRKGQRRRRRDG